MLKRSWSTTTCAVILAAGIMSGPVSIASAAPSEAHLVTGHVHKEATAEGKGLFRAIYFGVGPQVPEVRRKLQDESYASFVKAASTHEMQLQSADNVVAALERKNPKFFANFHAALTSGDVLRVDAQFKLVQQEMTELLQAQPQPVHSLKKSDTSNPLAAVPVFIWAAAVWDVAAAVNYAVGVNVAVAAAAVVVVYAKVAFWPSASTVGSRLESENSISDFTTALAHN